MKLKDVVSKECCFLLNESRKTEVLIEMMERIHAEGLVADLDNLKKEIFYREQLMSTGIGVGIGLPHVRFKGVDKPLIAVGLKKSGITDYESIDKEDVRIVIMIIVGEFQHKEHIRLLSQVMEKLKEKEDRETLIQSENSEEIYNFLTGENEND